MQFKLLLLLLFDGKFLQFFELTKLGAKSATKVVSKYNPFIIVRKWFRRTHVVPF